jgi:hypothetical protein
MSETPEQIQQKIDVLQAELAAAEETAATALAEIAALESQEAAAEVVALAAPAVSPTPSVVTRTPITGQFYQGQQGCDE